MQDAQKQRFERREVLRRKKVLEKAELEERKAAEAEYERRAIEDERRRLKVQRDNDRRLFQMVLPA